MKKGKLLTIMGVTNTGKTTQQKLLEERLQQEGISFVSLKYPLYKELPTGPRIHAYLKEGNPENLSPSDFQRLNVQNRFDFQNRLQDLLNQYDVVIAEMYVGTGIAYGMGDGISKQDLVDWNKGLILPDISILLDGDRFMESKEEGHIFEQDDEKTEKIRKNHLELADEFGWNIVQANQSVEKVHADIWDIVEQELI